MKFYTNITRWGNNLLIREYVKGQRLNRRVKYSRTLYMRVAKPTEYKTSYNQYIMILGLCQYPSRSIFFLRFL